MFIYFSVFFVFIKTIRFNLLLNLNLPHYLYPVGFISVDNPTNPNEKPLLYYVILTKTEKKTRTIIYRSFSSIKLKVLPIYLYILYIFRKNTFYFRPRNHGVIFILLQSIRFFIKWKNSGSLSIPMCRSSRLSSFVRLKISLYSRRFLWTLRLFTQGTSSLQDRVLTPISDPYHLSCSMCHRLKKHQYLHKT